MGLLQVTYTTLPVPSDYGSLYNGEAKTPVAVCSLKLDDDLALMLGELQEGCWSSILAQG